MQVRGVSVKRKGLPDIQEKAGKQQGGKDPSLHGITLPHGAVKFLGILFDLRQDPLKFLAVPDGREVGISSQDIGVSVPGPHCHF